MSSIFAVIFIASSTLLTAADYTINTIAGSDWVGDSGPGTSAILMQPEGVVADGAGNLYIADAGAHRVRRVSANGVIQTVGGTGVFGFSGDGGPASQAQLNSPYGLALDAQGNLYIADLGNARVRRVALDGTITTIAGGGSLPAAAASDGSVATTLKLSAPRNLALDSAGNLYISDFGAAKIYRLSPGGLLSTVAGTGTPGVVGDNGPAATAQLNAPAGLAFDTQGSLYIADSGNHLVRRVRQGVITSVARAATPTGLTFDGLGTLYVAEISGGNILAISASGAASSIPVAAVDLWCSIGTGIYASTGGQVVLLGAKFAETAVAGGGSTARGDNGPATQARLNHPAGVSMDSSGNIYIADRDNHKIRRVAPDGTITTVAGTGVAGNSGNGGFATLAQLNVPSSVTVDTLGNLYVADTGNSQIRKITTDGRVFAVTTSGLTAPVYAIADSTGKVYVADSAAQKIFTVDASGIPQTLLNGVASPRGMALDAEGNLYFTEAAAARVSRRSSTGAVTSIGSGWSIPRGVAVDASGNVFVADPGLQQVIEVGSTGNVSPIAGTATAGFSGDGSLATAAQLSFPWDVTIGANGGLLVADLENNRVRSLAPPAVQPLQTQPPAPPGASPITILNAASLAPGPVAPGMLLLIGGTGLGAAQLPDIAVTFDSNAAKILSASATGILMLAPTAIAGAGAVTIQVTYRGNMLASIPVAVVDAAPGLFVGANGQAAATNQDGSLNSQANPAARGTVISLYGTGFGISDDSVTLAVGNIPAQVLYAGPVTGYPGLFQINALVPSGYLPAGDLSVVVSAGSSPSQAGVQVWVN